LGIQLLPSPTNQTSAIHAKTKTPGLKHKNLLKKPKTPVILDAESVEDLTSFILKN
jgi:hypothetical protein